MQRRGGFSGVERRAVVLFVGFIPFRLAVQAERLCKQPVGVLCHVAVCIVQRLVTETHHGFPFRRHRTESVLLLFSGVEAEKRYVHTGNLPLATIGQHVDNDAFLKYVEVFFGERQPAYLRQHVDYAFVPVDVQRAVVSLFLYRVDHSACHPYGTNDVVGVRMSQKQVADVGNRHARLFKLCQDAVASTGVDHQPRHTAVDDEARVVASRHEGASRAEYGNPLCHQVVISSVCSSAFSRCGM